MARVAEAEAVLLGLAEKKTTEWVERLLARTRLALGDPAGALVLIDAALALLTAEHFRSEFLELRYDIPSKLEDAHARQDLDCAVAASQKTAERQRLSKRQALNWPESSATEDVVHKSVSRVTQLGDNIDALALQLSADHLTALNKVSQPDLPMLDGLFSDEMRREIVYGGGAVSSRH